jgi:hypothetical protein
LKLSPLPIRPLLPKSRGALVALSSQLMTRSSSPVEPRPIAHRASMSPSPSGRTTRSERERQPGRQPLSRGGPTPNAAMP